MKIATLLLAALSLGTAPARAATAPETLQSILDAQQTVTIQPVELGGVPVCADNYAANGVCGVSGYLRVVSFAVSALEDSRPPVKCIHFMNVGSFGVINATAAKTLTQVVCAR